jgi:hypothetical protein
MTYPSGCVALGEQVVTTFAAIVVDSSANDARFSRSSPVRPRIFDFALFGVAELRWFHGPSADISRQGNLNHMLLSAHLLLVYSE